MNPGPKKGYKQSVEHVEKRKRFGRNHHAWKGETVSLKGGRTRTLRAFPSVAPCHQCGNPKAERHHKDDNTANNHPANIIIICRKCYMRKDVRLDDFKSIAKRNQQKKS